MLEYIFFDPGIRDRFADYVRGQGLDCEVSDEDGCLALVAEDIDETLVERIDGHYDRLLQENAELVDEADEDNTRSAAGVRIHLADGTPCMVRLEPELASRLLTVISLEELRDLVHEIATQVENPDDSPICHT